MIYYFLKTFVFSKLFVCCYWIYVLGSAALLQYIKKSQFDWAMDKDQHNRLENCELVLITCSVLPLIFPLCVFEGLLFLISKWHSLQSR